MEAAIVSTLGLNSLHTHVLVLPERLLKLKTWDAPKQRLCVPRADALLAPPTAQSWAIAVREEGAITWHLFVIDGPTARAGKHVTSNVGKMPLVRLSSPAPVVSGWAYLPAPRLTPPLGTDLEMTQETVEHLLGLALQGAAEWLFFLARPATDPLKSEDEARLLKQYGTDEGALADTLFNTLVLPYAYGVRVRGHKRLRSVAGRAQAAAFERLAPAGHVERLRRLNLDRHVDGMKGLLPGPALAWVKASRAWSPNTGADDLLTRVTGEGPGGYARDYRQIRSDLARAAIVKAGQYKAPTSGEAIAHWKQQRHLCAPFVGTWNMAASSQHWALAADDACRFAVKSVRLVQAAAIQPIVAKHRAEEQARRARALYYQQHPRTDGGGGWEVSQKDRLTRLSALGATDSASRLAAFLLKNPFVPPCLKEVLARGRKEHRLVKDERLVLGPWLAALLPGDREDPERVEMLTSFALDGPGASTETRESLASVITTAVARREGGEGANKFTTGYACSGIIRRTLNEGKEAPCQCPYAALQEPSLHASGGWNIGPCVRACGTPVKDAGWPKVPLNTRHPLDRLLWAREAGALEW